MNRIIFATFISALFIFTFGNSQVIEKDSTESNKSARLVDPFPTVLGDTSSSAIPPPDYVEYSSEPYAIARIDPKYPREALERKLEGTVFVRCWIASSGVVRRAVVVKSASKYLNRSALEAALQWKFEPAKLSDGKPVDVWFPIPFRFRLTK